MKPNQNAEGSFDRENFREMMSNSSALTLEEYKKYSTASTVKNFYYSADISVNGDDNLSPVSNEENTETKSQSNNFPSFGGGFGGVRENFGNRVLGASSDFTLTGFSGEIAMTQFINGTASITEGVNFDENSGREYETKFTETLLATYTFANVADYEIFENEVKDLGLDDNYKVSSNDKDSYEKV